MILSSKPAKPARSHEANATDIHSWGKRNANAKRENPAQILAFFGDVMILSSTVDARQLFQTSLRALRAQR